LLNEDLKGQMIQGVEAMKTVALFFHSQDLKTCLQEERQLVSFAR
jgi:hypothetical protein